MWVNPYQCLFSEAQDHSGELGERDIARVVTPEGVTEHVDTGHSGGTLPPPRARAGDLSAQEPADPVDVLAAVQSVPLACVVVVARGVPAVAAAVRRDVHFTALTANCHGAYETTGHPTSASSVTGTPTAVNSHQSRRRTTRSS